MPYGLVGFGTAVGERVAVRDVLAEYTEDVERVLGYGYEYLHRAPADVGVTELAVEAGARALEAAGAAARDIDLVVVALTDLAEYLYWDAAAAVQDRLGLRQAEAVLVNQGCIGGVTAFDTLAGRFATHPGYRTALVIGANRTVDAYWNRVDTHSLLFSDGAAAAVAARDATTWRWRASYAETDGRYVDFYRMDYGGAARPFAPEGPEVPTAHDGRDVMEYFNYDSNRLTAFAEEINGRTARAVHRACRQLGHSENDLGRLILPNDNARVMTAQADLIGVPVERTNLHLASRHAHFGAGDHLFALAALNDYGDPGAGELLALAANGRGMHWACTILESCSSAGAGSQAHGRVFPA